MIRLNLMRNQFGGSAAGRDSREPTRYDLDFDSQENFAVRGNRKPLWFALAACFALALGGGIWWYTQRNATPEIPGSSAELNRSAQDVPPPTTPAPAVTPVDTPAVVAKDTVKSAPVDPALAAAARAESLKVSAKARKDSIAEAAARKSDSIKLAKQHKDDSIKLARQRREDSTAQAKARLAAEKEAKAQEAKALEARKREEKALASKTPELPRTVANGIAPAVTAPPLAGGVIDLVLDEARAKAVSGASTANRFEELAPTSRVAYQRFAFEQILNKLRQVTPGNGIGFTRIRIMSPGILVVDGEAGNQAVLSDLTRGLVAQSLVDTSSSYGEGGRFRITARLPFSASAAAAAPLAASFVTDLQRVIDLASAQGLELSKSAPRTTTATPFRRASWKLAGTGTWDGCSRWISSLGASGSPFGFTTLELASGPDGRLRLQATAIAYGK